MKLVLNAGVLMLLCTGTVYHIKAGHTYDNERKPDRDSTMCHLPGTVPRNMYHGL